MFYVKGGSYGLLVYPSNSNSGGYFSQSFYLSLASLAMTYDSSLDSVGTIGTYAYLPT